MKKLTLGASKKLVLQLIDEYSIDGEIIDNSENADYLNKHNLMADLVQTELAQYFPIGASYYINQIPLGEFLLEGGFKEIQLKPDQEFELVAQGAKSYYFELAGKGEVSLQNIFRDRWMTTQSFSHESEPFGKFETYKRSFASSDSNNDAKYRLLFQAEGYPFTIKNPAFYAYNFINNENVPHCSYWRRYKMPEDFLRLDEIIAEDGRLYEQSNNYRWEGNDILVLPFDDAAQLTINYWRYPESIDLDSLDEQAIDLPHEVASILPFKVAALIIPSEKQALSTRLLELYEAELSRIRAQRAIEPENINSTYRIY